MEDSEVVLEVYTHGELIRTGAGNCDAFINYKLVAGQRDGLPFQRYIKIYRVPVVSVGQRLAMTQDRCRLCS